MSAGRKKYKDDDESMPVNQATGSSSSNNGTSKTVSESKVTPFKREDESDEEYSRFIFYRDLPANKRTVRLAYEEYCMKYAIEILDVVYKSWLENYSKFTWDLRLAAYWKAEEQLKQQLNLHSHLDDVEQLRKHSIEDGFIQLKIGRELLNRSLLAAQRINPEKLVSIPDIMNVIRTGTAISESGMVTLVEALGIKDYIEKKSPKDSTKLRVLNKPK
jgi:hypothetical protein